MSSLYNGLRVVTMYYTKSVTVTLKAPARTHAVHLCPPCPVEIVSYFSPQGHPENAYPDLQCPEACDLAPVQVPSHGLLCVLKIDPLK